jgi:threonine/homoserine/homoserine lactone efflux protein
MFAVMFNGISTGLILQLAIGPVFFLILNITIQRTIIDGLFSVLAVTLVDYLYIALAILGVGQFLDKAKPKYILGLVSSIVLFLFGIIMIMSVNNESIGVNIIDGVSSSNYLSSFFSAFSLTISSPLTIVFWTSLFATKAIEKKYSKDQLIVFGIFAGLSTLLFLGCFVVVFSLIKTSIPLDVIRSLNFLIALLLIIYGVLRFVKVLKKKFI